MAAPISAPLRGTGASISEPAFALLQIRSGTHMAKSKPGASPKREAEAAKAKTASSASSSSVGVAAAQAAAHAAREEAAVKAATAAAQDAATEAARPVRAAPKPLDLYTNSDADRAALLPLLLITLATLWVLWLCAPGSAQWSPPVDASAPFLGFEYPGRATVGGSGGIVGAGSDLTTGDGGSSGGGGGAGSIPFGGARMGSGSVAPGTRGWWEYRGRKDVAKKLRTVLSSGAIAVVAGPPGSGRTSAVARFVDSTRDATGAILPHTIPSPPPRPIKGTTLSTVGSSSEYNVILWLDASSLTALHAELTELQSYLRIHSMRYDLTSVIANIHAWLYRQEKVLLIFDARTLDKAELSRFIPKQNAHTIVILTTEAAAAAATGPPTTTMQQGFDLSPSALSSIVLPALHPTALTKLFASIAGGIDFSKGAMGSGSSFAAAREMIATMQLQAKPGPLVTAALWLKRHQLTADVRTLSAKLTKLTGTRHASVPVGTILSLVLDSIRSKLHPHSGLLSSFLSALSILLPASASHVPKDLLEAVMRGMHEDEGHSVTAAEVDSVVAQFVLYGLAAEQAVELCGRSVTHVYFPGWFVAELQRIAAHPKTEGGSVRIGEIALRVFPGPAVWREVCSLLLQPSGAGTSAYLSPLLSTLGVSSSAAYFYPTPSVVAANPQHIPPIPDTPLLFLSALGAIVHDTSFDSSTSAALNASGSSPLRNVPSPVILQQLQRIYGDSNVLNQESTSCEVAWAMQYAAPVDSLIARSVNLTFDLLEPESRTSMQSRLDLMLLQACFHLDVARAPEAARALFMQVLDVASTYPVDAASSAVAGAASRMFLRATPAAVEGVAAPTMVSLESRNSLASHSKLLALHPWLLRAAFVPNAYTASALSGLASCTLALAVPYTNVASTEFQLAADVAINYNRLSLGIKRMIILMQQAGNAAPAFDADQESLLSDDAVPALVHPSLSSSFSALGHCYALQRNLDRAKSSYGRALQMDLQMQHEPITGAQDEAVLQAAADGSHPAVPALHLPSRSFSSPPRSHWDRVVHQLKLIRDLSVLSHMESMSFYFDNAHSLSEQASGLEAGLYGRDSLAVAARTMLDASMDAASQRPADSASGYAAALELHKSLLGSGLAGSTDLRWVYAQYYSGKSSNAAGRGRTGKRALDLAASHAALAFGGELHPGLLEFLETLGDTSLALGQHDAAMVAYRAALTIMQVTRGDSDAATQTWKNRVLTLYQTMQQAQEEQRRRQIAMQQEQMKKLQEQRQAAEAKLRKDKEEAAVAAAAAAAKKTQERKRDEL